MNWKTIFYIFILSFFISACGLKNDIKKDLSDTDFIYLNNNMFKLKGEKFFPIMLNYAICFRKIDNQYIVSPYKIYEDPKDYEFNNLDSAYNQLRGHLKIIKDMGFNSIRLIFDRMELINENYFYVTDKDSLSVNSKSDSIISALAKYIKIAEEEDVRIMLLIKSPIKNAELENFTIQLLKKFSNNPVIFAYDFFNEPLYFDVVDKNDKYKDRDKKEVYQIVKRWRKLMNDYAPNQMLTIGFSEPIEVFEWDPSILDIDFVSFHTYQPLRVPNEIYWYSKYCKKPWMLSETSLPADNDSITYDEQADFLKETYKRVVDCGGIGFGWWEFQEIPMTTFEANYTGLINQNGTTSTPDNSYTMRGSIKPAVETLKKIKSYKPSKNCNCWNNYYNMLGYNNFLITGRVLNSSDLKPVEGAVIRGWNANWEIAVNSYSDENGFFKLFSNEKCVNFYVSAPGMSFIKYYQEIYYSKLNNNFDINTILPSQKLEYHNISYKTFLKYPIDSIGKVNYIFNFEESKFNQAKFVGHMGIIKLEPLDFVK